MMHDSKPVGFMRRRGIEPTPPSPSPRPSPSGRGRRCSGVGVLLARVDILRDWMTISLSLRERARVRGNSSSCLLARTKNPGIGELRESSSRASGFPRRK